VPTRPSVVKYWQLLKSLEPGGGFPNFVFGENETDYALAWVKWEETKPLAWLPSPSITFVPETHRHVPGRIPRFAVSWVKCGSRYVVYEIITPYTWLGDPQSASPDA
jgi:hypothetical protein